MLINLIDLVRKYNLKIKGILHIGAHQGQEAELYNSLEIEKVLWVEGNPMLEDPLKNRIKEYKSQEALIALASDVDNKEVEFYLGSDSQASSMLRGKDVSVFHKSIKFEKSILLKTVRLESVFDKNKEYIKNINFLNLDIQGSELSAIKGLGNYIEQVDFIYSEVNLVEIYKGNVKLYELDRHLANKGFLRVELKLTGMGWGDAFFLRFERVSKISFITNLVEAKILQFFAEILLLKKRLMNVILVR